MMTNDGDDGNDDDSDGGSDDNEDVVMATMIVMGAASTAIPARPGGMRGAIKKHMVSAETTFAAPPQ